MRFALLRLSTFTERCGTRNAIPQITFLHKKVKYMRPVRYPTRSIGIILLALWLIVTGLSQLVSIPIPGLGTGLALLAIVAGILILIGW